MKYAAIMFDVVESRKYYDRYDVQNVLMGCVDYLNTIYEQGIKKNVVSSAGDEFQGLFFDLQAAFLYIKKLQLLIYPIMIRCGIGYGKIKYDVEEWTSSAFDGEAYYLARDAINAVKLKKSNVICFNTNSKYDRYLNEFCLSTQQIRLRQPQVANIIEIISDIMLPLKDSWENTSFYSWLLDNRYKLLEQEYWSMGYRRQESREMPVINYEMLYENRNLYNAKKDDKLSFYMDEFWVRGMSTEIARIMNTSRQNIDRYIISARIKERRTRDKAIFDLLGEDIWKTI